MYILKLKRLLPCARACVVSAVVAGFSALPVVSQAQENYPKRPISLVVPYTAGTGVDVISRSIARHLADQLGQPVVIDNKTGASGNIGIRTVARAGADGYTLLTVVNTFAINPAVSNAGYDALHDFAPVAMLGNSSMVLVVNSTVKAQTLEDLVSFARKNPGKLFYATPGIGSPQHMSMELFKRAFGLDIVHVPHGSAGEANTSVVGGQTNMMFMPVNVALRYFASGKIHALAVSTENRDRSVPEVPTVAEQGAPGFDVGLWYALLAPAGTPPSLVQKLSAMVREILKQPDVLASMKTLGIAPGYQGPAQLGESLRKEVDRWREVARDANIKAN